MFFNDNWDLFLTNPYYPPKYFYAKFYINTPSSSKNRGLSAFIFNKPNVISIYNGESGVFNKGEFLRPIVFSDDSTSTLVVQMSGHDGTNGIGWHKISTNAFNSNELDCTKVFSGKYNEKYLSFRFYNLYRQDSNSVCTYFILNELRIEY